MKHGHFAHIEKETLENTDYRRVLYTGEHSQLVLMSLQPGQDIGEEVHNVDQFFRFEQGMGQVFIDNTEYPVNDGDSIIVPAGTKHNVLNVGADELKLYTIYSPANHIDGTVHKTKADETEEHFDGKTTE
ncbi:MAG: cupin domain-containing protein [Candidatus Pacebacteria bacterium]|nr:cupin domain-containing protein [Candidatus Paceibacterota bacterium]MBP9852215.1 cupin domain-containing protein [Candidatus Paceibacterota bacterium]